MYIRHRALAARSGVLDCPCKYSRFLGDLWGLMGWLPGVLVCYRDPPPRSWDYSGLPGLAVRLFLGYFC